MVYENLMMYVVNLQDNHLKCRNITQSFPGNFKWNSLTKPKIIFLNKEQRNRETKLKKASKIILKY